MCALSADNLTFKAAVGSFVLQETSPNWMVHYVYERLALAHEMWYEKKKPSAPSHRLKFDRKTTQLCLPFRAKWNCVNNILGKQTQLHRVLMTEGWNTNKTTISFGHLIEKREQNDIQHMHCSRFIYWYKWVLDFVVIIGMCVCWTTKVWGEWVRKNVAIVVKSNKYWLLRISV